MKTLFYNCPAGLCGDMNLGAMVDLGADPQAIVSELEKLGLKDWKIHFEKDRRKGISGTRCDVLCPDEHHHRTFADIRRIIGESALAQDIKADALAVFRALAEAEGHVHGMPADDVHFHEVGAIDSILDIVGAAVCWKLLGVGQLAVGSLELGGGTVKCAHGRMPVPAPATAQLVRNFQVTMGATSSEATTPTGAALLAGKGCLSGRPMSGKVVATGIGIGQRNTAEIANVAYVTLLETGSGIDDTPDDVIELATNLDDMSPEHIAHLTGLLMEAGALDVWQSPAVFKKGRLGCVLSVLIRPDDREPLTELLFKHSTTIGVRWRTWNRSVLARELTEKETPLGKVRFKQVLHQGEFLRAKPEFDDLSHLAR
ncbi:MAG TPA: nickel pincer cofactor biosynthesis protein LarC, partial [Oceanipulchritudo sp.]|nr:nickel pincer cofactor biosynthesis protein LarC [Oceanipulchritudo sp.]